MKTGKRIEEVVRRFCAVRKTRIKTGDELDNRVLEDAFAAYERSKTQAAGPPNAGRIIMIKTIAKLAVAAVIIIAGLLAVKVLTGSGERSDGPIANKGHVEHVERPEIVPVVKDDLLAKESDQVKRMYAAGDVDGLIGMLRDGQIESKLLAARYLGEIGDERALGALQSMLVSLDNSVFAEAIDAIEARIAVVDINDANTATAKDGNSVKEGINQIELAERDLLQLVAAESMFCVRVNNFDYTFGQVDQFIGGIAPIPMAATMGTRMLLAGLLGDASLSGVTTTGNFALFGVIASASSSGEPAQNMFMGLLVPVKDFASYVSNNSNCSQADSNGVCIIKSGGIANPNKKTLITQLGVHVLVSLDGNYDKLVSVTKSIAANAVGLGGSLGKSQIQTAAAKPLWAYADIQRLSKAFKPMVVSQIEQMRTRLEKMNANVGAAQAANMYLGMLDIITRELRYVSLDINPSQDLLKLRINVAAVSETYMARMLSVDTSNDKNGLLRYLTDGSIINMGIKMNTPFWKELMLTEFDFIRFMGSDSISEQTCSRLEQLVSDMISSAGGPGVADFRLNAEGAFPFAARYVVEVRDAEKWNNAMAGIMDLWNTGGFAELYKKLGSDAHYEFTPAAEIYQGVAIDYGVFTMKPVDPNSYIGAMQKALYQGGFNFRTAMVNRLWLYAFGGNSDKDIRELIDQVRTGGPQVMSSEMAAGLASLDGADSAEFCGTVNMVRYMSMVMGMMYVVQGRDSIGSGLMQSEVPTMSNLAFAGKVVEGRLTMELALPKAHILETKAAIETIQKRVAVLESREQTMAQMRAATGLDPNVIADYNLIPESNAVITEEMAIHGLRTFAEFSKGRYPSSLDLTATMKEVGEGLRHGYVFAARDSDAAVVYDKGITVVQVEIADRVKEIQSACLFYKELGCDCNAAYYGGKVTTKSPQAVLLRWKLADEQYRVIFGDLGGENVTGERLAELEAQPLNLSVKAIGPSPGDGTTAGSIEELQLQWASGVKAVAHRIYFAADASQLQLLAEVSADHCDGPGGLESNTTYYWRVDEVQADGSVVPGDVWSFSTGRLTGWWKFDEDLGVNVADSSGNGYDGKVELAFNKQPRTGTWDPCGCQGGCLYFDGMTEVVVPAEAFVGISKGVTVSVWVNGDKGVENSWGMAFQGRSSNNDYLLYAHIPTGHGSIMFESGAYRSQRLMWEEAKPEDFEGRWNHYVFTIDADRGIARMYHNGVIVAESNEAHIGIASIESFTIGCGHYPSKGNVTLGYRGKLDEVMIYNYALSPYAVVQMYESVSSEKAQNKKSVE